VLARATGTGRVPVGAYGAVVVAEVSDPALAIADAVRRVSGDDPAQGADTVLFGMDVDTEWGRCALRGHVDGITPRGRVVADYGKVSGKRLLHAWISHLALCCLDPGTARTSCFFFGEKRKGPLRLELGAIDGARELLSRLVGIYWEGQRRPLALFPKSSYAYAAAVLAQPKKKGAKKAAPRHDEVLAKALEKAKTAWAGGSYADAAPGERDGDAVRILFGDAMPWELDKGGPLGFGKLALEILGPILSQGVEVAHDE
jgi:exodeoxyribonuclease V gamma subunit